jgi:hypothetical protein
MVAVIEELPVTVAAKVTLDVDRGVNRRSVHHHFVSHRGVNHGVHRRVVDDRFDHRCLCDCDRVSGEFVSPTTSMPNSAFKTATFDVLYRGLRATSGMNIRAMSRMSRVRTSLAAAFGEGIRAGQNQGNRDDCERDLARHWPSSPFLLFAFDTLLSEGCPGLLPGQTGRETYAKHKSPSNNHLGLRKNPSK